MELVPGLRSAIGHNKVVAADSMPKAVNTTLGLANNSPWAGPELAEEEAGSTPLGRIICALAAVQQRCLHSPPREICALPAKGADTHQPQQSADIATIEACHTLWHTCRRFPWRRTSWREEANTKPAGTIESCGWLGWCACSPRRCDMLTPLGRIPTPAVSFYGSPAWPPMQKAGAAWLAGTLMDPNGAAASRRFSNCGPGCQDLGAASATSPVTGLKDAHARAEKYLDLPRLAP